LLSAHISYVSHLGRHHLQYSTVHCIVKEKPTISMKKKLLVMYSDMKAHGVLEFHIDNMINEQKRRDETRREAIHTHLDPNDVIDADQQNHL
jgi:hypothetical protein